jgi:hypothetical protein
VWILNTGVIKMSSIQKGGYSMRSRSLLLVLFAIVLVILIGASTAMAKERVVQVLLPNCE